MTQAEACRNRETDLQNKSLFKAFFLERNVCVFKKRKVRVEKSFSRLFYVETKEVEQNEEALKLISWFSYLTF